MVRTPSQNLCPPPVKYKSLGLHAVLRYLVPDKVCTVLDLGGALGANVEFWSRYPCRLHIADLHRSYREALKTAGEEDREGIFSTLLGFEHQTTFDIFLAWDLFNYLDLAELEALMRHLGRWRKPGSLLFALISSQPTIPAEPANFRILDTENVHCEARSAETRQGPRHNPRDVLKAMSGFEVSSSFLMRNGIQEYVFICH